MALARDERRELAELLETLTPEQWATPSLCAGWSVRDVVAHIVSYEVIGWRGLPGRAVKALLGRRTGHTGARGFGDRANAVGLRELAGHTSTHLLALLRDHLTPRGLTSFPDGRIALTDGLIHQQDIRRPLGRPRTVAPERLAVVLPQALRAPLIPARQNADGLRLVATDVDWSAGDGPEVRGPGEAILMAIAGRRPALGDLEGDGVPVLAARL
ncbi:maleylpyruvate isomerase family mycothiol-dependent enzyme [Georgenia alba]|uniref:Maleylpyruvate isomerase family mycothiol-dependent enzyme n=1 Tax=Georgenia alba TaxID=2233858 RepID=A0ABW2QA00_9MICO